MRTLSTPALGAAAIAAATGARPGTLQTRIHGRDPELLLIRERMNALRRGSGFVIIVEGASGIGKSRLLLEAVRIARSVGARAGVAMAEPGERVVELAAFLDALFSGPDALLEDDALAGVRAQPEQRFWILRDVQRQLEAAARSAPLLIVIDDAQWIDSGTAAALRSLPIALADAPIGWLIAWRPSPESAPDASNSIERLERAGAAKVLLEPLESQAVERLAADLLQAEPHHGLLELVHQAAGSPYLVVETLLGLREEDRIRLVEGQARLIEGPLPERVQQDMRERLARLSKPGTEAATVAASLGRSFSFADLARTLGWQPGALLAPVKELLETNFFVERGDGLGFWHDITRDAVRASVPASARRAIDRWAAGVLLQSGALPVEVALQLAASAEPGDKIAVSTLLDAARTLLTSDPATAAAFGRRALEISSSRDPRRGEIVSTTVIALHILGDSDAAIAFADRALRETFPAEQEADVRLSIAGMFAISPEIRISAGRLALALPGLSDVVRARHLANLHHNLVTSGRPDQSRSIEAEAEAATATSGDIRSRFTLHLSESAVEYAEDSFDRARELVDEACREGIGADDDQRLRLAHMWRGELRSVFDRYDEALEIAADGLDAARRDRQGWAYQMFETWRGRLLFQTGQLASAKSILEERFAAEDGRHAMAVLDAAGVAALGRLALHTGDVALMRRLDDAAHVVVDRGTPAVLRHAAWVLALYAMANGDADEGRRCLGVPIERDGRSALPRFPIDVTDDVHVARIALAAKDSALAEQCLASARRRADLNPEVRTIAAVAAHVAGLVLDRPEGLEHAASLFETSPRRLAFGSCLEDLGTRYMTVDRDASIATLGRALEVYTEVGATWDARRVRSRLRGLGVRRRLTSADGPSAGWAALTSSETEVARLVAAGRTNREVADRLFLSPHTINSHLRHIFSKLDINSRVELSRIVADNEPPREGFPPSRIIDPGLQKARPR